MNFEVLKPEGSQFRFSEEEREDILRELVPDEQTRNGLSQEVIDLLIQAKEQEIREAQEKTRDRREAA